MTVRRIVTGHNADGKAVIAADEAIEGRGLAEDAGRRDATFFQLWATHEMPVDLTDAALARQREGSQTTILGTGSGTVLRVGVLEPGARSRCTAPRASTTASAWRASATWSSTTARW